MSLGPLANNIGRSPLPWRQTSKLHKTLGPSVIRIPLIVAANTPLQLFQGEYSPSTIDRIIGIAALFGQSGVAGSFSFSEISTGWTIGFTAATKLGNYWFNAETPVNFADLWFESSVQITQAMKATISLYNFEIATFAYGQS